VLVFVGSDGGGVASTGVVAATKAGFNFITPFTKIYFLGAMVVEFAGKKWSPKKLRDTATHLPTGILPLPEFGAEFADDGKQKERHPG
jgi:hypothetical protein